MADLTGFLSDAEPWPSLHTNGSSDRAVPASAVGSDGKESLAPEPATVVPTEHEIIMRDHTEEANGDEGERG